MSEWRDVPGYEGLYQVSDCGIVRSLDRTVIGGACGPTKRIRGRELSQATDRGGYKVVCLCRDGSAKSAKVHRIVAEAFIPKEHGRHCVNHIDGDKTNNSVENLEWCSQLENNRHAIATGLHSRDSLMKAQRAMVKARRKANGTN